MAKEEPQVTVGQIKQAQKYQNDFPLFAKECLQIQTKAGELIPFTLNRAQERVWRLIQEDLDNNDPVRMYILKARQLGFSTLVQGILYWLTSLNDNRNALVTAHEDFAASNLFAKSEIFYKRSPKWVRPMLRRSNRKELYFANPDPEGVPGRESRILVQTANNRNLGASMTLHGLHMSEFAKYESVLKQTKVAMATVLQTVAYVPNTFIFMETTADGMGYAHDFWNAENGYRKVFVSWVADESYRSDDPLPVADLEEADTTEWGNEREIRKHIIEELQWWYPEQADDKAWLERESLCRLRWRRRMISDQFAGDLDLFQQEYPVTPEEAFITSGRSVFDQRKLRDIQYALEERDEDGRKSGLVYEPEKFRFDKHDGRFRKAKYGSLRVYEPPTGNHMYVIGADVSEGLSHGDDSAAHVLKLPSLKQVAVYEGSVDPDDFGTVLFELGRHYGWAGIAAEINGPGHATVAKLAKDLAYPVLYERESFDRRERTYSKKVGWHTNSATKTVMISALRAAVRDDLILFRDLPTLDQMMVYVQRHDETMGAVDGEHDDLVVALAIGLQMALQRGASLVPRKTPNPDPIEASQSPFTFEWWARKAQETGMSDAFTDEYYERKYG